jgi:hypothetical protein
MRTVFVLFWAVMIFASIAWYASLLFYVGYKGGYEILRMARDLARRPQEEDDAADNT